MTRVAIAGAAGRMGQALIKVLAKQSQLQLTLALVEQGCASSGQDSGVLAGAQTNGVQCTSVIDATDFEILIDFSEPSALCEHLNYCVKRSIPMVTGVTGLDEREKEILHTGAKHIALVYEANMSIGANVAMALVSQASKVLADSEVEIMEMHHRYKKDAPSGTALSLGDTVARARGDNTRDSFVFARASNHASRAKKEIGFSSMRGGDNIGEHTVMFISSGERLEISHRALDRAIFAHGALRAATWVVKQKAGLYNMRQVLGI